MRDAFARHQLAGVAPQGIGNIDCHFHNRLLHTQFMPRRDIIRPLDVFEALKAPDPSSLLRHSLREWRRGSDWPCPLRCSFEPPEGLRYCRAVWKEKRHARAEPPC